MLSLSGQLSLRVVRLRSRCRSSRSPTRRTSVRVESRSITADASVNGRVDDCAFITVAGIPVARSHQRNLVDVEALAKVCSSISEGTESSQVASTLGLIAADRRGALRKEFFNTNGRGGASR